jgi:hypothetical protein
MNQAATRVGDTNYIQHRLQRSPLQGAAVHREKQDLGLTNRPELGQSLGQHPALALGQGVDAGWREADGAAEQLTLRPLVE